MMGKDKERKPGHTFSIGENKERSILSEGKQKIA